MIGTKIIYLYHHLNNHLKFKDRVLIFFQSQQSSMTSTLKGDKIKKNQFIKNTQGIGIDLYT